MAVPYVASRPLAQWLRLAARRHPDALALESRDTQYTYGELLAKTEQLSRALRESGFRPGDRVAIAATRSSQSIVSILACVDSEIAYAPLDLTYPSERLRAMVETVQPRAVLGQTQALAQLETVVGQIPSLEHPAPAVPAFGADSELTYILFTSGSTGRPKGVAMGAKPLAHLIEYHSSHSRLGREARVLQFAPLSFDVHFQEIFSTLACGGTLVLVPESVRRDPVLLHAALCEKRIERIFVPYVALQMIADASADRVPSHLRDVISAGEQLQITPAIRSLFERLPGAELHNHYGPTESHVVTAHELTGDAADWPTIPPIGRALPHVQLALRSVETGEITSAESGELLLGGETLANGYLGSEELSDERFRNDFPGLAGRWYVTGDLVTRDDDGIFTYLGRADHQLKIDGFRIEPGEIEVALMGHPLVKEAVVTAPDLPGVGRQLVAYLVLREAADSLPELSSLLRAHLRQNLPEYMIPVRFTVLDHLPITPSGKIDRRSLPVPSSEPATEIGAEDPLSAVRNVWKELLGLPHIEDAQNLFDLGARSLLVLRFISRMKQLGFDQVTVADVYDRPTVVGISETIQGQRVEPRRVSSRLAGESGAVAIIGMASRTAGARTVDEFWMNLLAGKEGIRHFQPDEIDSSIPESVRSRPNFVAARGVVEDVECFDAAFFGVSARESVVLDPQQRMMLELSWTALEHAGVDPSPDDLCIGVYAGTGNNSYISLLRSEQPELISQFGEFATMLASEKDYVATRVAHRLNLSGPAVSIHTACSTGLVAVAEACEALLAGQCDLALAGGASVIVPQEAGYLHVEGGMESVDGHCRPFDADASGTVFASGGAVVVLRRLEDALASGDTVYAVVRGVGLNNDGADKASFTAPSVTGQAGAIRMAMERAGVSADSIGYVEAHGTGTALGDPIELAALTRAWREHTDATQYCGIGSLKSNLGHTVAAAGVLGLIKTALALHHEVIPATLHYRRPNPQIDFASTPFYVVAKNTPWPRGAEPRRAAVSSFGVGGTNAHIVIEEAPADLKPAQGQQADRLYILPLSARDPEAVLQRAKDLANHLERYPERSLEDVAATLMRGRRAMSNRVAVVVRDSASAAAALRSITSVTVAEGAPRVVFLFPGQGSQHPGMARQLYDAAPAFRAALDECLESAAELNIDLKACLVDADPDDRTIAELLDETRYAQPALFAVSYALAEWLESLGVHPHAMIGHSIGEYAAACRAGVLSMADGMKAVVARGAAMFAQPRGAMLAVYKSASSLKAMLPADIEIAACNAPELTVVAGPVERIDEFYESLGARGIGATRLRVSHAFHSASMEPALPVLEAALSSVQLNEPRSVIYSGVSGEPLSGSDATAPTYWCRQVRKPVQFSRAVESELARDGTLFVEVGPSQALTALVRQHRRPDGGAPRVIPLMGPAKAPGDPALTALKGLAALWCAGVAISWPVPSSARRIALPTYPFKKERYWFKRRERLSSALPMENAPSTEQIRTASQLNVDEVLHVNRLPEIEKELRRIMSDVSGIPADELQREASFLEQGLDSLSMTQASLELERVFGVSVRFRRLMEDLDSLELLTQFLDSELPDDKFVPSAVPFSTAAAVTAVAAAPLHTERSMVESVPVHTPLQLPSAASSDSLIDRHLYLIEEQLRLVRAMLPTQNPSMGAQAELSSPPARMSAQLELPASEPGPKSSSASAGVSNQPAKSGASMKELVEKPFGASARITLDATQQLTQEQRRWLEDFIRSYNARTRKSKEFSQTYRKLMSDPRVVTGFNPQWKELVYPIVVERSKGARLWDLDGNEYLDLLSAFGANMLGYQPDYLVEAISDQLHKGLEVGPQHPLAAEVAALISEFTGMERVAFCNTGSEAVMGAIRIARTVTGRKTVAIFTNSYHGIFDEVIVRGSKQLRPLVAAPGIPPSAVENMLVLDFGSDEALQILTDRGSDLAAIMIEPIQNKCPTLQPRDFVRSLREIADQTGCALIFDEVVTGFRVAPGGAQEFYGVPADIATYGKVIGGGLPLAAIAGTSRWLDALDGGHWSYGDDSYPESGVTYFAGTFVRHPLALAAGRAALLHLKEGGRPIYDRLNALTQAIVDRLNTAFEERGAPVEAVHCASLWRLAWDDKQKHVSLFYYLARHYGLHLYEQFGHFVTEAYGEQEVDRVVDVFLAALDELMEIGFITRRAGAPIPLTAVQVQEPKSDLPAPPVAGARAGKDPSGRPGWFVPDPKRPGKYLEVQS